MRDGPRRSEFAWYVHQGDLNLADGDRDALHEMAGRHPQIAPDGDNRPPLREAQVLDLAARQLRGALLVTLRDGTAGLLAERMRACGIVVPWARYRPAPRESAPPPAVRQSLRYPGALGAARRAEALFDATPQRSPG